MSPLRAVVVAAHPALAPLRAVIVAAVGAVRGLQNLDGAGKGAREARRVEACCHAALGAVAVVLAKAYISYARRRHASSFVASQSQTSAGGLQCVPAVFAIAVYPFRSVCAMPQLSGPFMNPIPQASHRFTLSVQPSCAPRAVGQTLAKRRVPGPGAGAAAPRATDPAAPRAPPLPLGSQAPPGASPGTLFVPARARRADNLLRQPVVALHRAVVERPVAENADSSARVVRPPRA